MLTRQVFDGRIRGLFPSREDWRRSIGPIARGSLFGFILGIIPGVGTIVPQFLCYALEKRLSPHPERFGTGEIEGVVRPKRATTPPSAAPYPLFSLGIPSNAITAVLLGALMIYGLTPGPLLIRNSPDFFWGVIASMYIGNVFLLVLNLPLIPLWVRILKIPYEYLAVSIILFCLIGAYSLNNNITDIYIAVIFSLVGLLMKKFAFEPRAAGAGLRFGSAAGDRFKALAHSIRWELPDFPPAAHIRRLYFVFRRCSRSSAVQ